MNDQFDELAKALAQSVTRRGALMKFGLGLAAIALATLGPLRAADLYVDASTATGGDGSTTSPYARITDAVERARQFRQAGVIPASEAIVVHVAPGTYMGSYDSPGSNKRLELLPIVLNVPNVVLSGATALALDAQGLPTGIAPGTAETILASTDPLASRLQTLVAIVSTTDGGVGNDVTVTGFTLEQPESDHFGNSVYADHVSGFAIRGNRFRHAGIQFKSIYSSGALEQNLISESPNGPGALVAGGSGEYPAQVTVRLNRIVNNAEHGLMAMPTVPHITPDLGRNNLTAIKGQFHGSNADAHSLEITIMANDLSQNGVLGLRFLMICPTFVFDPAYEAQTSVLRANVINNTLNGNGNYGLDVEGGDVLEQGNKTFSGRFVGTFSGNQMVGNGRHGTIFTYTFGGNRLPGDSSIYLRNSIYDVLDIDGELADFDYANPLNDPIDGTPLNNALVVNGAVVAHGIKISPRNP